MTKGETDARAALHRTFGFFRTLVRVHAVHPSRVGREAHDEERVVRKRDALCRTPHPVAIAVERSMLACAADVLLRLERHGTPRAEREVYDARAAHDVECLVRVLEDVVCACAVELDGHVDDWVMQCLLDVCADRGHRGRECVQRRRFVSWVAVDWVAVRYACRSRERENMCFNSWLAENVREGWERRGRRVDYEVDDTVLTCRPALLPLQSWYFTTLRRKVSESRRVARAGPTDLGDA